MKFEIEVKETRYGLATVEAEDIDKAVEEFWKGRGDVIWDDRDSDMEILVVEEEAHQ